MLRPSTILVDRRGSVVRTRQQDGEWIVVTHDLSTFDSMMTHCADPRNTPEMLMLREQIRGWRFYDQLRTDAAAPARLPQVGTHTPVLGNHSDGTLRYLLWVAALLTPRPPGLLVLNEPETSLHPDLLPALVRLIARASERAQMVVVSHAARLIDALQQQGCHSIVLDKTFGETKAAASDDQPRPAWQWPSR